MKILAKTEEKMNKFIKQLTILGFWVLLTPYPLSLTAELNAASWPLFRGTPERSGSKIEEASPSLSPVWNYPIQGEFISSPVVYKGIVYCGGRDGSVWAADAATGEALWQYSTDGWVDSSPCVSTDTVFAASRDKTLYAFNRLTGDIKWQTYTGSADCSSPLYYGGRVYLLSGFPEKKIYAFDAQNGKLLNSYQVGQFGFSSPAVMNGLLFFGTNDGIFHCLDLNSGTLKWSKTTRGGIFYSCVAAGSGYIYAVSGGDERKIFCLNPYTGAVVWESAQMDTRTNSVSSVSLGENAVFFCATVGSSLKLFSFPLTGTSPVSPNWSVNIGYAHQTGILSSPAVLNDTIYAGSGDGRLYAVSASNAKYIEPATGNLSDTATGYYLSYTVNPSTTVNLLRGIVASPAVSNGMLFVGTYDGMFWAFRAAKTTAITSPDNNESIIDGSAVEATIAGPDISSYKLEYGQGENPSAWTEISSGTATVSDSEIAYWDTAGLTDGIYSLKLTTNNNSARKAQNRVVINNAPRPPAAITVQDTPFDGGGSLTISWPKSPDDGALSNDVLGYRLYKSSYTAGFALIKQLDKGTTYYADSLCTVYTTYYYYVTAFDSVSESVNSSTGWSYSLLDGVEITPELGGTVRLEVDGLITEVVVEPGSVDSKVWIGIRIPETYENTGIAKSANATKIVREFGVTPEGTVFLKPVTIKIPYRESDIADIKRDNLRIYWWDTGKLEWRVVNTSDALAEKGRVWARIPHFSLYRIMEYLPGREELLVNDKVYTYPNPAKGSKVAFKYYLGDKADVFIDVYNVAGERIAHLQKEDNPAGLVSEIEWDISQIASGVYVYRVEAKSVGGANVAIKKKLAVIH